MAGTQTVDTRIHFIGRDRELQRLRSLWSRGGATTIVGPGGVGKSRLAFEALIRFARARGHRTIYVALAGVASGAVTGAIIAAAGTREQAGRTPLQTLREELGRHATLLVLDNCEHVTDEAKQIITALLGTPNLCIVATSRGSLEYPGETVLELEPFGTEEGVELLRARARTANVSIHRRELDVAREIVSRLDGLPVAIDVAAARLASLSLRELAIELEGLQKDQLEVPERPQRTVCKVVRWSRSHLDPLEQLVFTLCSFFSDAFRAEDVAALLEGDLQHASSLDVLGRLASKSLLVPAGFGRFTMLAPIRSIAANAFASQQDSHAVEERFALRMNAVAVALRDRAESADAEEANRELFNRYDDFCTALEWALQDPTDRIPRVIDVATVLVAIWGDGGRLREGRMWMDRLLAESSQLSASLRGRLAYAAIRVAHSAGEFERMLELGKGAVSAFTVAGERLGLARTYNALSIASLYTGKSREAESYVESAISLYEALNFDRGIATALINHGNVALEGNCDPVAARCRYERALEILLRTGPDATIGIVYGDLAETAYYLHDMPTSESYARLAIARFTRARSNLLTAWAYHIVARTKMARADLAGAERNLRHGLELLAASYMPAYLAVTAEAVSRFLSLDDRHDSALLAAYCAALVREHHSIPGTGPAALDYRALTTDLELRLGPVKSAALSCQASHVDLSTLATTLTTLLD